MKTGKIHEKLSNLTRDKLEGKIYDHNLVLSLYFQTLHHACRDEVTVASTLELEEALRVAKGQKKILKLWSELKQINNINNNYKKSILKVDNVYFNFSSCTSTKIFNLFDHH